MNIMFIGAHPDDIEYSCGGTISRLCKEGHKVKAVVCTHKDDNRFTEGKSAFELLGVHFIKFFDEQDGLVSVTPRLVRAVEREIEIFEPDIVITHTPFDTHQDHRNVAMVVKSACRKGVAVGFFDSYSSENFMPNCFIRIDNDDEVIKEESLKAHRSQRSIGVFDIVRSSKVKSIYHGSKIGAEFAEAFCLERIIL